MIEEGWGFSGDHIVDWVQRRTGKARVAQERRWTAKVIQLLLDGELPELTMDAINVQCRMKVACSSFPEPLMPRLAPRTRLLQGGERPTPGSLYLCIPQICSTTINS